MMDSSVVFMQLPSLSFPLPSPRRRLFIIGLGTFLAVSGAGTLSLRVGGSTAASTGAVRSNPTAVPPAVQSIKLPALAATPQPTKKPIKPPTSRFIRVGLATKSAPIALWSQFSMTITDSLQPGRKLTVKPRAIVTFFYGAYSGVTVLGQRWQGPLRIKTSAGVSSAWQSARVWGAGAPTHVSTNGDNPRWQRAYRGGFDISPQTFSFEPAKHRSALRVINVVPLEEYLKGVVPWEMNPSAPLEALKAQSICARSITLSKIALQRHTADGYDICDYDHCQGYSGTDNEKPRTTLAVAQTAGLVVWYRGRVADAVYGTNSGGITAAASDVWRGQPQPHLQSVRDFSPALHRATAQIVKPKMSEADWQRYCSQSLPTFARPGAAQFRVLASRRRTSSLFQPGDLPEFYRWTRAISPQELAEALGSRTAMEKVTEMRVLERAASGHIKRLLINGKPVKPEDSNNKSPLPGTQPLPSSIVLDGDSQIRAMLSGRLGSTTALPSSTFVVLPRRDAAGNLTAFVLKGAGWGHGAGMCQRGAQNRAAAGWNARRIINFYFRDVEVRKIA